MKIHSLFERLRGTKPASQEAPIQNLDSVDIIGKRKDGGVDLVVVASGPLTADAEIQQLLRDKIRAYLGYINSDEFRSKFNNPPPEKTVIEVACYASVDPVVHELVERMKPWAEDNNARIRLRTEKA